MILSLAICSWNDLPTEGTGVACVLVKHCHCCLRGNNVPCDVLWRSLLSDEERYVLIRDDLEPRAFKNGDDGGSYLDVVDGMMLFLLPVGELMLLNPWVNVTMHRTICNSVSVSDDGGSARRRAVDVITMMLYSIGLLFQQA